MGQPPSNSPSVGVNPQDFHRHHKRRRLLVVIGLISISIFTILVILGVKSWLALHNIVAAHSGTSTDALKAPKAVDEELSNLKAEGQSRVNILLLGVGDANHAGALLSDTLLVASIEPQTKSVVLIGLPRDLYVPIPGHGNDKINSAHVYGELNKTGEGPNLAKQTVEKVLDIPIHYYMRADFSGFKKAIDTLGGVKLTVANSLFDSEYPCDNDERRACGFSIKAGTQSIKGDVALKYVRCRKGNCGNDFGRAARQQQVLLAMREKAMSLSTLSNPAKLSGLIDTIGSHAKTDISVSELNNLSAILNDIQSDQTVSKVIDNDTDGLVQTANLGGASVVIPKTGVGKFDDIKEFVHSLLLDRYIDREKAKLVVHNATGQTQFGQSIIKTLQSYHYNVIAHDDVSITDHSSLKDLSHQSKAYTLKYLEKRFHVATEIVSQGSSEADIELTVGKDFKLEYLR